MKLKGKTKGAQKNTSSGVKKAMPKQPTKKSINQSIKLIHTTSSSDQV